MSVEVVDGVEYREGEATTICARLSCRYRLVAFSELSKFQYEALGTFVDNPEFGAVLLAEGGSGLGAKVISHGVAAALATLDSSQARPLPLAPDVIEQLCVNGVIEIERHGGFVTGPRLLTLGGHDLADASYDPISKAAIEYALHLPLNDLARLAARIYFFNREPRDRTGLHDSAHAETHRAINEWKTSYEAKARYKEIDPEKTPGWRVFARKGATRISKESGTFKVYVCPKADFFPRAIPQILQAFSSQDVATFKVGSDPIGVIRPDKVVAYFSTYVEMEAVLPSIREIVPPEHAQGTPFTAPLTSNGSVSWGFDPPILKETASLRERESWRVWVCNRIAPAGSCLQSRRDRYRVDLSISRMVWDRHRSLGTFGDTSEELRR